MENQDFCETCGHSIRKWKHSLTSGLVNTFIKFCYAVKKKGINSVHLQTETDFTKNQYNNFQKLRYFALVAKDRRNPGQWVITRIGGQFMRGEIGRKKFVVTYQNYIVDRLGPELKISDYYKKTNAVPYETWQKDFTFQEGEANYEEII